MNKGVFSVIALTAIACALSLAMFLPYPAHASPFYGLMPSGVVLVGEFSTDYSSSGPERAYNVELAAKRIDGYLWESGSEFSFNRVVGKRTEKNGFKEAKVIVDGAFTEGVGGGVCQVSTTVYNAFLLAGMTVSERHPHSLAVSYVPPSQDAMVADGVSDLKAVNTTKNPAYIRMAYGDGRLTARVYAQPSPYRYRVESTVVKKIAPPAPKTVDDVKNEYGLSYGETRVIAAAKEGLESIATLYKIKDGKTVSKKRLSRDVYRATPAKIVRGCTEEW